MNNESLNKETLKGLAYWGKFLGWTLLIAGAINAVIGLVGFVVGAIPGIITFLMGQKLLSASKQAEAMAHTEEDNLHRLNDLLADLKSFFKIYGVFTLVSFLFFIVFLVIWLVVVGATLF